MKALFLAAGAGSRMKEFYKLPKPLIEVKGKPLLWWAVKSFHELITNGTINSEDIFIAILKDYEEEFLNNPSIRELFGSHNPFIVLDAPTNGPVETAVQAITQLRTLNLIARHEGIVISDSDHFVQSINICRNLNQPADLYLWEAQKDKSLEWSFLSTTGEPRVIEKPDTAEGININRGLIGVYGFADTQLFMDTASELLTQSEQEVFISHIVNKLMQNQQKISVSFVDDFYPMGTHDQLRNVKDLPDPLFAIFDSPTYFIDIDGVLVRHNTSVHGHYPWLEDIPITENVRQVKELFKEAKIVIVSARSKKYENEVTTRLLNLGIDYDELVLGCTGGLRFLINDLKPKAPFIPTANAINIVRNSEVIKFARKSSYKNISGGSGATSVSVEEENTLPYVIKFSRDLHQSTTLNYQANWYKYMESYQEINTLKIVEVYNGDQGFIGYSTLKIDKLESLHSFINRNPQKVDWVKILKDGLHALYSASDYPELTDYNLFEDIIIKKVIPSIDTTIQNFEPYPYLIETLQNLRAAFVHLGSIAKAEDLIFKGRLALIHGDPTFENLQVDTKSNQLVLLDPVGKLIEPKYDSTLFKPESYPVFDLARLELSFKYSYEKHMRITQDKDLNWADCEDLANSTTNAPSICSTSVKEIFKNFEISNLNPVLATTVGRILKYKSNPKEVFILATQCLTLVETIIREN